MEEKQPTFGHGKICFLEIPSVNIAQSADFYSSIFNWQIREDNAGNVSFDDGVGEVSGMFVASEMVSAMPAVIISIMVDDVKATLDKIVAKQGRISMPPTAMQGTEMIARFADPSGNIFSLYQHNAD